MEEDGSAPNHDDDTKKVKSGFSIFSWNINGLRTIDIDKTLTDFDCEILAVQETKISRDQLPESVALLPKYSSYFSFCKNKSGYAGVATYCKKSCTPTAAEEGLSGLLQQGSNLEDAVGMFPSLEDVDKKLARQGDADGRAVITQIPIIMSPDGPKRTLVVINVYCPRLRCVENDGSDNLDLKLTFHKLLGERARNVVKNGSFVLIVGDMNITYKLIDQAELTEERDFELYCKTECCRWFDELFKDDDFQDTFRALHPDRKNAFTCWNTRTGARENNFGTRIDYIIADKELMTYLESADIHPDVFGSDHCPVSAKFHTLIINTDGSAKPPSFCTINYPEFAGKQQTIKKYFQSESPKTESPSSSQNGRNKVKAKQTTLGHFFTKKPKLCESVVSQCERPENIVVTQKEVTTPSHVTKSESQCKKTRNYYNGIQLDTMDSVSCDCDRCTKNVVAQSAWKGLMKVREAPLCAGHREACVIKTVKKKGPNLGRQFFSCPRGRGLKTDANASCEHFEWVKT